MVTSRFRCPRLQVRVLALASSIFLLGVNANALELYDLLGNDPTVKVDASSFFSDQLYVDEMGNPLKPVPDLVIPDLEIDQGTISIPSSQAPQISLHASGYDSEDTGKIQLLDNSVVTPTLETNIGTGFHTFSYHWHMSDVVIPGQPTIPGFDEDLQGAVPIVFSGQSITHTSGAFKSYVRYNGKSEAFDMSGGTGNSFTNWKYEGLYTPSADFIWTWDLTGQDINSNTVQIDVLFGGGCRYYSSPASPAPVDLQVDSVSVMVNGMEVASNLKQVDRSDILFTASEPISSVSVKQHFVSKKVSSVLDNYSSAALEQYLASDHTYNGFYFAYTGSTGTIVPASPYLNVTPLTSGALSGVNDTAQDDFNQYQDLENQAISDFNSSTSAILVEPTLSPTFLSCLYQIRILLEQVYNSVMPAYLRQYISVVLLVGFLLWMLGIVRRFHFNKPPDDPGNGLSVI